MRRIRSRTRSRQPEIWAETEGWEVAGVFSDENAKAYHGNRVRHVPSVSIWLLTRSPCHSLCLSSSSRYANTTACGRSISILLVITRSLLLGYRPYPPGCSDRGQRARPRRTAPGSGLLECAESAAACSRVNPSANNDPDDTSSLLQSRPGGRAFSASASGVRRSGAEAGRWPRGARDSPGASWNQKRGHLPPRLSNGDRPPMHSNPPHRQPG